MAIPTSFKQQCPSCEAMVPIRDPKLVGRKIDCPKCKYRFVVEEPVDEVEELEDDAPPQKGKGGSTAITNKKAVAGKAAKGPSKRRADDDQDIETKPKKKQGGSGMMIVGILLAGVAVIALAVGALFIFSSDSEDTGTTKSPRSTPQRTEDTGEVKKPEKPAEPDKPKVRQDDITNLLPNDTQIVLNLPLEHLLGNDKVNQALLNTPGSFNAAAFQRVWGIAPNFIRRVVIGANNERRTVFSVMRTSVPLKESKIVENLRLKAEAPINDFKYYFVQKPLDALSTFLLKGNVYHERVALLFMDPYTVVCADAPAMNQFLLEKGQPRQLSKKVAEEEPKAEPPQGGRPGGPPGGPAPMGMQGGPPGGDPRARTRGNSGGPGGPGGAPGGFQPPQNMPGGMAPPGMAGDAAAGVSDAAPISGSYMTIDPHLKAALDQAEKADKTENQNVLFSIGMTTSAISTDDVKKMIAQAQAQQGSNVPQVSDFALKMGLDYFKGQLKAAALGVTDFNESKVVGNAAVAAKDATLAQDWEKKVNEFVPGFISGTGLDFAARNSGRNQQRGGMGMMGGGPPGGMMGGGPPGGMMGGGPPGGVQDPRARGGRGSGFGPPGGPLGGPNGMQGGMQPQQQGEGGDANQATGKLGNYGFWTKDNVLALGITFNIPADKFQLATSELEVAGIYLRSVASMADRQSHIHELAAAMQAYFDEKGHFPRGAYRQHDAQRFLEWRPDQRLSWMKDLLPYLASGEFKGLNPKDDKAWYEGSENGRAGVTVIPQFVTPMKSDSDTSFYVAYPNLPVKFSTMWAATHYVGMAGVGMDAAEYRADDATKAKLRGVFGYDRETKKDDIKDGLAQTIVLIQVPPEPKSPWIAGGGSTVRGVSEDLDCVKPFVSTEHEGKRGTFAIMADGKVRFIPETINPKTFQALCTIAGDDKVRDLDKVAPEVAPLEDQLRPELKATEPAPATPPAKQIKNDRDTDLQKLQGTWVQVGGESQGKALPADMVQKMGIKLVVTGDSFILTWNDKGKGDASQGGALKLDETKSPSTFDGQVSSGRESGTTLLGIYSLSGDELKLCYSKDGKPRPVSFSTKAGESGTLSLVFKRGNP